MISVGARRLPGSRPRNLCGWLLARLHSSRAIGLADGVATTRARWRVGRARSSPLPRRPDVSLCRQRYALRARCVPLHHPTLTLQPVELWRVPACRRRLPRPGTRAHGTRLGGSRPTPRRPSRARPRAERGLRGPRPEPRAPWPVRVSARSRLGGSRSHGLDTGVRTRGFLRLAFTLD